MGVVIVDGIEVEVGPQERLNGIQAAERAGIDIPRYCWHPGLSVVASCRMCLVETGNRNPESGAVTMFPKLVPACQTPAKDGTVFITTSDKVKQSRAFVEEALLIDHPIDCPICDKAGECYLQDYHFEHGQKERRADIAPFTSRRRDMGDTVTLFVDRCVMCTRCVRFTREIAGTSELLVINRGAHEEIDVIDGFPLENKLAGNVVDLCPVGALGDKDFLYSQRVWFMQRHPQVCTGCSTGCSIYTEENQDRVYRVKPRENPHVNQWWICDDGRYGYHHVHSEERLIGAVRQAGDATEALEWSAALPAVTAALEAAGRLAAVLSPHLTVEEAYALAKWIRQLDPEAVLALGPVTTVGADETFKNGFTIRAEKCPNRRGVEEVLRHFTGGVTPFEALVAEVDAGKIGGLWVTAGSPTCWIDDSTAERLAQVSQLVVQDLFASPLWERATFRLPGVSFAERAGSYVNVADRLQTAAWAVRPPAGARVEGSVYWELLGYRGLYAPRRILDEVAQTIPYFAAAAEPVPPTGVALKAPELAAAHAAAGGQP
ncbi:MAG: (2Fe-2S)-binding protein [Planctomycetaceae bacterium]|nr:(2Fe-2S)-binding protein [Planctomycetaceae bacterium]